MLGLGAQELLLIGVIALVVIFGARKFGDIGTGLGDGIRNFKKAIKGEEPKQGGEEPRGPEKP